MAKVLGVGGIFFRSGDPEGLIRWYHDHLGILAEHPGGASFPPAAMPPGAFTVWSPFREDNEYFEPSRREFMINLVVDDLDGALAQVRAGGAELVGEVQSYEYGRFGWFVDPDGNKVELWQPAPRRA
jgi:predicted enzyme related to lactoylglutathione lyase